MFASVISWCHKACKGYPPENEGIVSANFSPLLSCRSSNKNAEEAGCEVWPCSGSGQSHQSKSMKTWDCGNQQLWQVESVWSSSVCRKNDAFGALKTALFKQSPSGNTLQTKCVL